ncbi:MAG: hypothetical protein J6S67_05195 [Methanobrevibacter sp.]|nr:hypothetical protein [Methanobrevibacter sp.]
MGMYKKIDNNTLQKLAGYTVIADGSCAEIRQGTASVNTPDTGELHTWHITFTDPMPDADYEVLVYFGDESTSYGEVDVRTVWRITNKTANGFDASYYSGFTGAGTKVIHYTAFKLIPMEGYTELKNKVDNPDTTPTENSTNLCTSGGIYDFVKNASSIFVGTSTEWASATQTDYDIAVITDEHKILSIDKTAGTTDEQANLNKIFRGTLAEWEALSQAEKDYYDQAEIDDDQYMANVNQIVAHDKVVAVADWQADATYSGFSYKAEISMPGVTADYSPDVRFDFDDINSGLFAPVADAGTDKVIIYANAVPAAAVTIPVIICTLMSV